MKARILLTKICFFIAFFCHKALAVPIISGISANEIEINTNFKGSKILLFGAKGYTGNIVVSVRGPKRDFVLTKKSQKFGIWYNGQRVKIKDIYSYYSIFSTFNENKIPQQLLSDLELGKDNIAIHFFGDFIDEKSQDEFKKFFYQKLEKDELYSIGVKKVDFLNETLFKVMLEFPKAISRGIYSVDIYLMDDGSLISYQTIPIYVRHDGISAKIFDFAYENSFFYALIAIFSAIIIGWLINFIFTKIFSRD